ncbi:protein shisa-5 isoform X2 [Bombina bombina]|uniref:protein shisa-5 isoform X2 n=1 Tax=Bombina bombina TaxID=8345 RepID=UPI00235A94A4|nr:protein shisa-5 isoform X2 [Bombina bombina]
MSLGGAGLGAEHFSSASHTGRFPAAPTQSIMAPTPIALLGALSLLCLPGVFSQDCAAYIGNDLRFHQAQTCILSFCSGTCVERYCSIIPMAALDQGQFLCVVTNFWVILGAAIVIGLIVVAGVVTCICKSCCGILNMCTGGSRHTPVRTSVQVTNVIPRQPVMPVVVPMAAHGYQPVMNPPMYAGPANKGYLPPPYPGEATAPPSYPTSQW